MTNRAVILRVSTRGADADSVYNSAVQSDTVSPDAVAVPDEQLLAQVLARDAAALQQLYQRHSSAVYSLAQYILRESAVAEELTQEIFLTVWNKAEQYHAEHARFRTWLLSITRNRAIDQLRQRRRRINPAFSLDDESVSTDHVPLSEPIDTQRELHLLLRHLPPEQRLAIELCYFEGYTHEEIAARLKIPLGTLKSRILLGLKKLRVMMQENHG